jgi:hypothetical protein
VKGGYVTLRTVVLLVGLVIPVYGMAQQKVPCPNMSGIERTDCLTRLLNSGRSTLEHVISQMFAYVDTQDFMPAQRRENWKQKIREGQTAWVSYLKLECEEIQPLLYWGAASGAANVALECQIYSTALRIRDLKRRYNLK